LIKSIYQVSGGIKKLFKRKRKRKLLMELQNLSPHNFENYLTLDFP